MFKKPGRDTIGVWLLVGRVEEDLRDFRFRGRPKGRKGRRCGGKGTEYEDVVEELLDKRNKPWLMLMAAHTHVSSCTINYCTNCSAQNAVAGSGSIVTEVPDAVLVSKNQ